MAENDISIRYAQQEVLSKAKACESGSSRQKFFLNLYSSLGGTLSAAGSVAGDINQSLGAFDHWMITTVENIRAKHKAIDLGIQTASLSAADRIRQFGEDASHDIFGWKMELNEALKPVSTAMGSTVDTATAIVKNPLLAPQLLGNSMIAIIDKINPGFANEIDGAFKSVELEALQHLPGKVMGSVKNLLTATDAILSIPFELASSMYNGLMEILDAIADSIDMIYSFIMDFIFGPKGLLDNILQFSELQSFFDAIAEVAVFAEEIGQLAGGFAAVSDVASQIGNISSDFSSILQDPLQLAQSYIPGFSQVTGGLDTLTGALRDPEQYLQTFLPPEISQQMQEISQIPGLGFVGNLGYSVGDTLDTLSKGVFNLAAEEFSTQAPILGGLFNQKTEPPAVDNQESYSDSYQQPGPGQGIHQTAAGTVAQVYDTSNYKVLKTEGNTRTISAYGVEEKQIFQNGKWIAVEPNNITAYRITAPAVR